MHTFEALLSQIDERMSHYAFPEQPERLYEACRHILTLGGKRIRPVLVFMAKELFGEIDENTWHAAIALEIFHNFTLVHDDIMDNADKRRGRSSVHKKFDIPTAILAGDVLNIHSYELINRITHKQKDRIVSLVNKTAIQICEGQQMDMNFGVREDVSRDEYLEMIRLKTSVLLAGALQLGAILANTTEENIQLAYEFGANLGIAFQIKDDYLDAFGDEIKTGKKKGGDILANKKTILYCLAMENRANDLRQTFRSLLSLKGDRKVEEILHFYQETGIDRLTVQLMDEYDRKAFKCLDNIQVDEGCKSELRKLAIRLLKRES